MYKQLLKITGETQIQMYDAFHNYIYREVEKTAKEKFSDAYKKVSDGYEDYPKGIRTKFVEPLEDDEFFYRATVSWFQDELHSETLGKLCKSANIDPESLTIAVVTEEMTRLKDLSDDELLQVFNEPENEVKGNIFDMIELGVSAGYYEEDYTEDFAFKYFLDDVKNGVYSNSYTSKDYSLVYYIPDAGKDDDDNTIPEEKEDDTYGCDMCGKRVHYETEINWLTSEYGICDSCIGKYTGDELERITEKLEAGTFDEDKDIPEKPQCSEKTGRELTHAETIQLIDEWGLEAFRKGYVIHENMLGEGLSVIERLDSIMLFDNDKEAADAAKSGGIDYIECNGLFLVDTEEARKHVEPVVSKMLSASTENITDDAVEWLLNENPVSNELIAHRKEGFSAWFIVVDYETDTARGVIPDSLADLLDYAKSLNVEWLDLDEDAEPVPALKTY